MDIKNYLEFYFIFNSFYMKADIIAVLLDYVGYSAIDRLDELYIIDNIIIDRVSEKYISGSTLSQYRRNKPIGYYYITGLNESIYLYGNGIIKIQYSRDKDRIIYLFIDIADISVMIHYDEVELWYKDICVANSEERSIICIDTIKGIINSRIKKMK
jgi:hypothetical protein